MHIGDSLRIGHRGNVYETVIYQRTERALHLKRDDGFFVWMPLSQIEKYWYAGTLGPNIQLPEWFNLQWKKASE